MAEEAARLSLRSKMSDVVRLDKALPGQIFLSQILGPKYCQKSLEPIAQPNISSLIVQLNGMSVVLVGPIKSIPKVDFPLVRGVPLLF